MNCRFGVHRQLINPLKKVFVLFKVSLHFLLRVACKIIVAVLKQGIPPIESAASLELASQVFLALLAGDDWLSHSTSLLRGQQQFFFRCLLLLQCFLFLLATVLNQMALLP